MKRINTHRFILCIMGLLLPVMGSMAVGVPEATVVFQEGEGGYHSYRIPAIIASPSGTLLAFCEGRKSSRNDAGDIDLLLKRSTDQGKTWSAHSVVYEEGIDAPITIGNPCPVVDHTTGVIWLAFTRNNARAFVTSSQDDGHSWSKPMEITGELKSFPFPWKRIGTGPVNGIHSQSGRLLFPVWLNDKIGENYRSAVVYSDDQGKTWQPGSIIPETLPDTNECVLVETASGKLYMNLRNKHPQKRRGVCWSSDGGLTWSKPQLDHELLDPICQGSALAIPDTDMVLFVNAASIHRERLTLRISHDGAQSWGEKRLLWTGPAAYSCLVALPDGAFGCLFESGGTSPYECIRFIRISL